MTLVQEALDWLSCRGAFATRDRTQVPKVVLLDLKLPKVDGLEVLHQLRTFTDVYVILVTARAEEVDKLVGLGVGADDYVTKPFSPRELVLRAQAILRRGRRGDAPAGPTSFGDGELRLDEERREALVRGTPVELTPTEWGILMALAHTPGRVYSRYELINRVRGYEFEGYERTIDSHVKNLRRKIEVDARSPRLVLTVLGGGYRLGVRRDA